MRTAIIVQARETSERLPGKALKPLGSGTGYAHTPIDVIAQRCLGVADALIFAIPDDYDNDALARYIAVDPHVSVVRGHPTDLASRRYEAARFFDFVAIAGADDCLIDREPYRLAFALAQQVNGYVQTEGWPIGCGVQVMPKWMLADANAHATGDEREHLTLYFDRRPLVFPRWVIRRPVDRSDLRLTLDTPDDLALFRKIVAALGPAAPVDRIIEWLNDHPDDQVRLPHYVPEGTPVPVGHAILKVGDDPSKAERPLRSPVDTDWSQPARSVGDL